MYVEGKETRSETETGLEIVAWKVGMWPPAQESRELQEARVDSP